MFFHGLKPVFSAWFQSILRQVCGNSSSVLNFSREFFMHMTHTSLILLLCSSMPVWSFSSQMRKKKTMMKRKRTSKSLPYRFLLLWKWIKNAGHTSPNLISMCLTDNAPLPLGAFFWDYSGYFYSGLGITEYTEFQFSKERPFWKWKTHGWGDLRTTTSAHALVCPETKMAEYGGRVGFPAKNFPKERVFCVFRVNRIPFILFILFSEQNERNDIPFILFIPKTE